MLDALPQETPFRAVDLEWESWISMAPVPTTEYARIGSEDSAHIVMIAQAAGPIAPMSAERRAELLKFWGLEHQGVRP